ncbi:hypothetical protein J437_LFUL003027 [Ladona fulva]|uniref:Uncharacterized protein n=1 Tax=Ladona fulva TaxID=123851 RepID=A0A8K0NVR3_LADFU|nr:hypothetical protein J437_LFUL003027 [Ladona fulva]
MRRIPLRKYSALGLQVVWEGAEKGEKTAEFKHRVEEDMALGASGNVCIGDRALDFPFGSAELIEPYQAYRQTCYVGPINNGP